MEYSIGCYHFIFIVYISYSAAEIPSPPLIVKQPPTDEVLFQVESGGVSDKPFYIECEAVGEPAPKYYWIKNGKPFNYAAYDDRISRQRGRGTLSISKPSDVDVGQYQCFAENQYGIASSNSVFMRKAELNSFKTTIAKSLVGQEGEPFKLTCTPPDGWPKPVVHWIYFYTDGGLRTINSSRMTLDPEGNLWFSNLTKADGTDNFKYACAATSPTKFEYKYGNMVLLKVEPGGVSAALNKHEPVLQYVTRKNEVAYRGKRAELYCIFGGTPLPQTVWSKNGYPLESSDRITQGNFGKSLVIKTVDFNDEGTYTCEVSNGVGEPKSYSINLKVMAVPYFTVEPEVVNEAEGETAIFRCEAAGVPKPEIKWIHNGKPIADAPYNPRRKVYKNKIIIDHLTKNDTGNYGCNATNTLGYVYKDVYVNVMALPPEILEAPRDTYAVENQNVTMTCKVMGAPKPIIKWFHDENELTGGRFRVQQSGDLQISNVQFNDKGVYTCYAENKLAKDNATARLDVKSKTYIKEGPEDYEVIAGQHATFRCTAISDESLDLEILWLRNGQAIDFESEPRFVKSTDYSLTISKTSELDSGTYTCVAKTELDEDHAQAQLIVQDKPNPPINVHVICKEKEATISWKSQGDKRAPISHYIIQHDTSFTPGTWDDTNDNVPSTVESFTVPLNPWTNYTFRVIAVNKIGRSIPSNPSSEVCSTPPSVPHKNPDNVVGEGDKPTNLIITWNPMPQIEHSGPGFKYRVYWKRDLPGKKYDIPHDIYNWTENRFVVEDQPTFQQYKIKIKASNDLGDANVDALEVIGFSGEDEPTEAPTNFTYMKDIVATKALLSWNPVSNSSVRGHFKGYKIKTWSDNPKLYNEIQVQGTSALVSDLAPFTTNHAQVYVYNGKHNGPPSEILSFDTPEGVPGQMHYFEAAPLGSSAFLLKWEKPTKPNGILRGYNISYAVVNNMDVGTAIPRKKQIEDPEITHAKLCCLNATTKYRIFISARTKEGLSEAYYIERSTRNPGALRPSPPSFNYELKEDEGRSILSARITWLPNENNPGSYFKVKYREKGQEYGLPVVEELEDFTVVPGLQTGKVYDFVVTSVDNGYETDSEPQEISTEPAIRETESENVATASWFIGMMLAIAFLLLVLIIVCIVKRNRGGKYAVHEREQANGRHDYPEEGGFHEYSQPLDNKSHGRASMSSEPKIGPESDTDSMAEYGDGDTEGMNEDGSFIGQYGRKRGQGETTSQGFATLV